MLDKQSSSRTVVKVSVLLAAFCLLLIHFYTDVGDIYVLPRVHINRRIDADTGLTSGFLLNTNGCRIPDLDPFDISIRKFLSKSEKIDCAENYGPALVLSNLTALYINTSALAYYNVTHVSELNCCYTPFWRLEMTETQDRVYPRNVDSQARYAKHCIKFFGKVEVQEEFVRTRCLLNNDYLYVDYHAFVPVKKVTKTPRISSQDKSAVNVLIVGVDAVSRLNLYRQMPLTVKFLKRNLSAVDFLGYNKVADNTFPNLIPVFTGMSETELISSCWQEQHYVFDDCKFIWDNFSAAGYRTAFAEDASWMGMFQYMKFGFRKQPTDYYTRIFNMKAEEEIGFEKRLNAKLCVGPQKNLKVLLDYAYKFVNSLKEFLFFGFFWGTSLTHDFLNLPAQGDKDHLELLEKLYLEGVFSKSVLIFMSDHGMRWGPIRQTYQGYLEERLPFLFIVYPDWFRERYTSAVSNMKRNTKRLTTPFDLHETLLDLVNLNLLTKEVLRTRSHELIGAKTMPRGISLFLPISSNRTCQDAGIVDNWCTCHHSSSVPTNDTLVNRAADHMVSHINNLLVGYSRCATLQLSNITSARQEMPSADNPDDKFSMSDAGVKYYSLVVVTTPGKAMFEANIRYNGNSDIFNLAGSVSRINLYGSQSSCVPHYKLKLYCYCIQE